MMMMTWVGKKRGTKRRRPTHGKPELSPHKATRVLYWHVPWVGRGEGVKEPHDVVSRARVVERIRFRVRSLADVASTRMLHFSRGCLPLRPAPGQRPKPSY